MTEQSPVYIVNGKRVDANGKPVKEVVSSTEATDTGSKKSAGTSRTQTKKAE